MKNKITYQDVIQELKNKFGEDQFGYFNDKRKEFRRVKIFGRNERMKKQIHSYLKRKYGKQFEVGMVTSPRKVMPSQMYYMGPTIKFPI